MVIPLLANQDLTPMLVRECLGTQYHNCSDHIFKKLLGTGDLNGSLSILGVSTYNVIVDCEWQTPHHCSKSQGIIVTLFQTKTITR